MKYKLYHGDCFKILKKIAPNSVYLIFADPPYFLSTDSGITCQGGKMASVIKGSWDKEKNLRELHSFNRRWIRRCFYLLKDTGSLFVSGTFHNIYSIGMALQQEGYKIVNNITWQKLNPPPNLSCKCFTHSTETILWSVKDKKRYYFNYALMKEMNGGKQMKDVWSGALTPKCEKAFGKHPTKKPEYILEKIILAASKESDTVLDPFCGSGTTGVVALRYKRFFIGIENDFEYIKLVERRIQNEEF